MIDTPRETQSAANAVSTDSQSVKRTAPDRDAITNRRQFLGLLGSGAVMGTGLAIPATGQELPVVAMGNTYYDPIGQLVSPGTTVRFEITSGSHSVTAYDNRIPKEATAFDSGVLSEGAFEHTFEVEGTYDYYCIPHKATQVGRIVVGEPGGPAEETPIPDGHVPDSEAIVQQGSVSLDDFEDTTSDSRGAMSDHACTHGGGMMESHTGGLIGGSDARWNWVLSASLLAAVVGGGVALVVGLTGRQQSTTDDDAINLLRARYQQGKIDEEEFKRRRRRLYQDE